MHSLFSKEPTQDVGFVSDNAGNLSSALPRGDQIQDGCGLLRLDTGDVIPTGEIPTKGFLTMDSDMNLGFRTV